MRAAIAWAVHHRAAMNLILIATMLIGILSLGLLRREVFPNFELDIVLVQVPYPGASPEEVEEGICLKIEEAVRSIDGIKRVTTIAREGIGFAVIDLNAGVDAQRVLNEIRSDVDRIPSMPELAEDPQFQQITFRQPAIRVGVMLGEPLTEKSELQLRELAEQIRDELLELASVSQVTIVGERPYQIDVEVSEQTLRKYGLSLQKLAGVIRRENVEIPGGKIQTASDSVLLRGKNKRIWGEQIAQIPVVTRRDGTVLTVGDLGQVHDGFEDSVSFARVNGQPAIVLSVDRTSSEDLLRIVDEVKQYTAGKQLPAGYSFALWNDTSIDVRERIDLLTEDGLQGLILVFLVLAIFLEFRLAFWVALGIPFAILATCAVLFGTGDTLNMLTLFSFLMALGILVDDAIVVSENFHAHMEAGKDASEAAIDAASEVAPSVIAGVFCTVIAFIPLFFVTGVMGKFIACMPLTVVVMLLISLVEGFTILPCHLGHEGMLAGMVFTTAGIRRRLLGMDKLYLVLGGWVLVVMAWLWEQAVAVIWSIASLLKMFFDRVNRLADKLVVFLVERTYIPTLKWIMQRIPLSFALQFALLVVTLTCVKAGWTKYTVFPDMDARNLTARIVFPDGTPAHVTDAAVRQAAQSILKLNEASIAKTGHPLVTVVLESVGHVDGGPVGPDARTDGEFLGSVTVELVGAGERTLTAQEIAAQWREATGPILGVESAVFDVQQMGPGGKDIEFKMQSSSQHWAELEQAVEKAKEALARFDGVYDVNDDSFQGKWEYQMRIDPRGHSMGVSTADLAETVRAAFYGEEVQRLQRGRHEVKLMVRYPRDERSDLVNLENIRVRGSDNIERPISELAAIDVRRGYSEIQRVDQQRAITISASLRPGTNAGNVLADFQSSYLNQIQKDYPFLNIRWEGEKEQNQESVQSLAVGSLVALGAMCVLLTFQLRSIVQPLMIVYLIPFAVAGAIWGHIVMRLDVTLFSVFGLVALMGMVVNDSIVLLDFINARRAENPHEPLQESIIESSRRRIRPVALNTVTSVIGLAPLLADQSFQAQALIPMAVSLVFGLATSTILGLLIVPTLYYVVNTLMPDVGHIELPHLHRPPDAGAAEISPGIAAVQPGGLPSLHETPGLIAATATNRPAPP